MKKMKGKWSFNLIFPIIICLLVMQCTNSSSLSEVGGKITDTKTKRAETSTERGLVKDIYFNIDSFRIADQRTYVFFAEDDKTLVFNMDKDIILFDLLLGRMKTLKKHSNTINSLTLSPNCQFIASGDESRKVFLWNLKQKKIIRFIPIKIEKYNQYFLANLLFSPDNKILIIHGGSAMPEEIEGYPSVEEVTDPLLFWDIEKNRYFSFLTQKAKRILTGASVVAISPDGRYLIMPNGGFKVWDMKKGVLIFDKQFPISRHYDKEYPLSFIIPKNKFYHPIINCNLWGYSAITFSPDGKSIAVGTLGDVIEMTVSLNPDWKMLKHYYLGNHSNKEVNSIKFSPDSKLLATGGDDNSVKLWDLNKKLEFKTLTEHGFKVTDISFSSKGNILVSAGHDVSFKFWSIPQGKLLGSLYFFKDFEWIIITPEGYFDGFIADSSKKREKLFQYVLVLIGNIANAEDFEKFYKPGLLKQIFGKAYKKYIRRAKMLIEKVENMEKSEAVNHFNEMRDIIDKAETV